MEVAVTHLGTQNQVIQFEAVGVLKCLLTGNVPKDHITQFVRLEGVVPLLDLSNPKEDAPKSLPSIDGSEDAKPDPRVMFETCRLLCRLCVHDEVQQIVGTQAIAAFMNLIKAPYLILQSEGAQALLNLSSNEKYFPGIAAIIPELIKALDTAGESTSRPLLMKTIENVKAWILGQENLEDVKKLIKEL